MKRGAKGLPEKKVKEMYDLMDQGVAQRKIAKLVGCSETTVQRYGKKPRTPGAITLDSSIKLGTSGTSFYDLTLPPKPPAQVGKAHRRGFYIPVSETNVGEILAMASELNEYAGIEWIEE